MAAIGQILLLLLDIALWIVLIQVVISWLVAFEVINLRNPTAARAYFFIERLTAPVYKPLRRFIPPIAGIDLTPIVIVIAIYILQAIVREVFLFS